MRDLRIFLPTCLGVLLAGVGCGSASTGPSTVDGGLPPADAASTVDSGLPPAPPTPPGTSEPCAPVVTVTNLDGVTVRVLAPRCNFTLSEARAGIALEYEVTVAKDLPTLYRQAPVSVTATPFAFSETLSGNGQSYCICDVGPRQARVESFQAPAGSYRSTFKWDGVSSNGPSDTPRPEGRAFPVGVYTLALHAEGGHVDPGPESRTVKKDYAIDVSIPIHLVER